MTAVVVVEKTRHVSSAWPPGSLTPGHAKGRRQAWSGYLAQPGTVADVTAIISSKSSTLTVMVLRHLTSHKFHKATPTFPLIFEDELPHSAQDFQS